MPNNHKSSPLFGWLSAGSDLISAQLESTATTVSKKIDDTHSSIEAMQRKGAEVEGELKRRFNPVSLVDSAQQLVMSTPLFSLLSGGKARLEREHQIALLSAKVDLLVEQVALLAAKRAAEKALTPTKTTAKAAPKSTAKAASKTTPKPTAKATPKAASKPATKTTAAATKAASKTTTAKTPVSAKSTTTTSAASKPAATKTTAAKASGTKPQATKSSTSSSGTSTATKTNGDSKADSDS
jgi:outer membrane biosynthesis protein TonB